MLNIYMNNSDIKNQISAVTVILKRDLKCIMYISIDKTFTVYMIKLQSLTMMMSIVSMMKMMKLKL